MIAGTPLLTRKEGRCDIEGESVTPHGIALQAVERHAHGVLWLRYGADGGLRSVRDAIDLHP